MSAEFDRIEELVVRMHQSERISYANRPEERIKLKSGRMSPHIVNLRGLGSIDYSDPAGGSVHLSSRTNELAALSLVHLINGQPEKGPRHIVGLPEAMTMFCGYVAAKGSLSALFIRVGGAKNYGVHKPIEGAFQQGDLATPLDDVITTSGSKLEYIPSLESAGLVVPRVAVLVDREEGGAEALAEAGYGLVSVVGMGTINEILRDRITPNQYQMSQDYLAQYAGQIDG